MTGTPRVGRRVRPSLLIALALFIAGALRVSAAPPAIVLTDLDDKLVDPFRVSSNAKAVVFLFASVSCPVSNRYAPEIGRLHDAFASKGAAFWLVYPNPAESPDEIRKHLKEYSYPLRALRDPKHELVKLTQVVMTPEAAVFDQRGTLAYRGRIDDRYVSIGTMRPAPTRRDLQDALTAVLAGRSVTPPTQPAAAGCFIADFVR
jgi:hypothetical protein